jgi:outer membrane protein assembly factor BamB
MLAVAMCLLRMAFSADYPQWRGPDGSGATADSGVECIDDMVQAKVVWKSETIPNVYNLQMKTPEAEGGYTSPSMADSRIYMQWYQPAGEAVDENRKKNFPDYPPELWKVYADDVFICFDAKTGKTLWKRVFEKKGAYLWGLTGLMHTQPAVHAGRVYGVGSLGRVYCMDAKTGEPVWESTLGEAHTWAVARLEEWLKAQADSSYSLEAKQNPWIRNNRAVNVFGQNFDGSLFSVLMPQLVIDPAGGGLLVCSDGCRRGDKGAGDGLVGIDLATGERRWYVPDAVVHRQSPTVWTIEGRPYVLHSGDRDGLVCRDALTGKKVWNVKEAGCTMDSGPVVSGPYIVVHGAPLPADMASKKVKQNIGCYKADAAGATQVWTVDPATFFLSGNNRGWVQPVIYRGHLYCGTQISHTETAYGCIDMADGAVKKIVSSGSGAPGYSAILAADGRLIMDWEVLDADPANFRLLMKSGDFKEGQDWAKLHGDALIVLAEDGGEIVRPDGSRTKVDLPNARMFQSNLLIGGFYYYRGPHNLYCIDLRKKP